MDGKRAANTIHSTKHFMLKWFFFFISSQPTPINLNKKLWPKLKDQNIRIERFFLFVWNVSIVQKMLSINFFYFFIFDFKILSSLKNCSPGFKSTVFVIIIIDLHANQIELALSSHPHIRNHNMNKNKKNIYKRINRYNSDILKRNPNE